MRGRHIRLRVVIQGIIIVSTAAALVVLRIVIGRATDNTRVHACADIILLVFFVCTALILLVHVLYYLRDKKKERIEPEDIVKLKARAQTDALTGLLNRETSIEQITDYLKNAGRSKRHALMMIDLDNFKNLNDSFGHFEGDRVLQTLAEKTRAVFRSGDIVGRLGGDEFIVLMKEAASQGDVRRKALELQNALEYMTSGGDVTVTITGSIGISYSDDTGFDGRDFDLLYREADEALYRAKNTGKNRYCFFDEDAFSDPGGGHDSALTVSSAGIELKALIDNIDGGIALLEIGKDIRSIYLSRSYVRMMHLNYDAIKQADNRILTFIHPEDMEQVDEKLHKGAESGLPVESVFRRLTVSGKIKWYHMRAVRIAYEYSDKPVLIAIVTEVTNLKETELKFQAQKKQLETVLRVSHVVTFEVDIPNRSLIITDPTVIKYGIDTYVIENMPEALIDNGAIHPDSIDECRRMYDEIYAGVPEGSAIVRTLRRSGEFTIERFTYFTVRDDSGKPVKAVGIAEGMETDNDRKLRVAQLEKQFRRHSENMLTVVEVILSKDSVEFLKTDPAHKVYEKKHKTYSELFDAALRCVADQADREYIQQIFGLEGLRKNYDENRTHISREYRVRSNGGKTVWNSVSAGLYINELDGEVYAFIQLRDVTRKRELEAEFGTELERGEHGVFYTPDAMRGMGDAIIARRRGGTRCAVALLAVANHDDLLYMLGKILISDLLFGFIGKAMMILKPEHLISYDGKGCLTVLLPEVSSAAEAAGLMERIIKFLKNPAFFQFREELHMEYACAVALEDESTEGFDALCAQARKTLREGSEESQAFIRVAGEPAGDHSIDGEAT